MLTLQVCVLTGNKPKHHNTVKNVVEWIVTTFNRINQTALLTRLKAQDKRDLFNDNLTFTDLFLRRQRCRWRWRRRQSINWECLYIASAGCWMGVAQRYQKSLLLWFYSFWYSMAVSTYTLLSNSVLIAWQKDDFPKTWIFQTYSHPIQRPP